MTFQVGDYVVHRWDPRLPEMVMEVRDLRDGEIKVGYLNGDLICGESETWFADECFDHASLELLDDMEFVDHETVFVGAI